MMKRSVHIRGLDDDEGDSEQEGVGAFDDEYGEDDAADEEDSELDWDDEEDDLDSEAPLGSASAPTPSPAWAGSLLESAGFVQRQSAAQDGTFYLERVDPEPSVPASSGSAHAKTRAQSKASASAGVSFA